MVTIVIAAIEQGFCPTQDPVSLGPSDWARLSSAFLAAVGRGYQHQCTPDKEAMLDKAQAEAIDPASLPGTYLTYFH